MILGPYNTGQVLISLSYFDMESHGNNKALELEIYHSKIRYIKNYTLLPNSRHPAELQIDHTSSYYDTT
jgi:hypothetical protein